MKQSHCYRSRCVSTRALLKKLEWIYDPESGDKYCEICNEWKHLGGHADNCELNKELIG